MKKKLVIIDGSSLFIPRLFCPAADHDIAGRDAYQCHIRFLRMLLGLYRDLDPEYMAVTFDKDRHTFRTDMFADYKAPGSRRRRSSFPSLT